ncbi:hypothetical protein VTN49DRAFT_1712 [Thermomyces lanuginosus]|uniref:uncharacterized protein n=1 Tax=Thermomyces lanuginosus TaxID=5541 RepID=UPI00374286A8
MSDEIPSYPVGDLTGQSPPIDWSAPVKVDVSFVKGKTILVTGGASGIGAGFCKRWASYGANIIMGDISVAAGEDLIRGLRQSTGNPNHHFVEVDISNWESQVRFFQEAVRLSPTGAIDTVVANAGVNIQSEQKFFNDPATANYLDPASVPPPPQMRTLDVNLTGTLYTAHLALWFLSKNTGPNPPENTPRDRHLLLIGSVGSVYPLISQSFYTISKHAIMGLFRVLRMTSVAVHGIRVNMICPYFVDTSLLSSRAGFLLAGGGMGAVEDVVQAGSVFVSRPDIVGRAVFVGPRLATRVCQSENSVGDMPEIHSLSDIAIGPLDEGHAKALIQEGDDGVVQERAIWEIYSTDFQNVDVFTKRMVRLVNAYGAARGWSGYFMDMFTSVKKVMWGLIRR